MGKKSGEPRRVLSLVGPTLRAEIFTPEAEEALAALADVSWVESDEKWSGKRLIAEIAPYDGLITTWGSPRITDEVLDAAPNLKIVAHSAGSVKFLVDENVLRRDLRVSSASVALAPAVAESALIMVMLGLRHIHEYDHGLRRAGHLWDGPKAYGPGEELAAQTIGVIGAGFIGRIFIEMVRALGARVRVCDPYLSQKDAAALDVETCSLNELMAGCRVVVVHAPTTPETHHMIGARELSLLPDNALIVNTARSWVMDQDKLLAELQTGRIRAALDVFDIEPLPMDHPFRGLPNVILTPHMAGATLQARWRQGDCVVRDLTAVFTGTPMSHEVTLERYPILA